MTTITAKDLEYKVKLEFPNLPKHYKFSIADEEGRIIGIILNEKINYGVRLVYGGEGVIDSCVRTLLYKEVNYNMEQTKAKVLEYKDLK